MAIIVENNVEEAIAAKNEAVKVALEIIGQMCESYAKLECPVDTGRLRGSISHRQIDDSTEAIGTNVEYAPYVELGTSRMSAQPFLKPAASGHASEYAEIVRDCLS